MTIREAITRSRVVANKKYIEAMCHVNEDNGKADECIKCADEHKQLADWLDELIELRQFKETAGGKTELAELMQIANNAGKRVEIIFENGNIGIKVYKDKKLLIGDVIEHRHVMACIYNLIKEKLIRII